MFTSIGLTPLLRHDLVVVIQERRGRPTILLGEDAQDLILRAVVGEMVAYLDKQTASDVTTTIFTACIGYLVSYAAASTTEKVSRNRHGLDADGNPFQTNNTEGGSDTSGPTLG